MKKAIFCGRGPSGPLHLGHLLFYRSLAFYAQEKKIPIIFQFSDDQKLHRDKAPPSSYQDQIKEDLKILGTIFRSNKVFYFSSRSNLDYRLIFNRVIPRVKLNYLAPSMGLSGDKDALLVVYPYVQAVLPLLFNQWGIEKLLIGSGGDQCPYFDLSKKIGPSNFQMVLFDLLPATDLKLKMSSSNPETIISIADSKQAILRKIKNSSSGATSKLQDHKRDGLASPSTDFCYLLLTRLNPALAQEYLKGSTSSSEVKLEAANLVSKLIEELKTGAYQPQTTDLSRSNILSWIQS